GGGHCEVEVGQLQGIRILDLAAQDGVDDGAGGLDGDALAGAVPAGVGQVGGGVGGFHAIDQHVGVLGGVQAQEGRAEAGGEGGGGLGDAALGARQLGGEAGQEVVLGLVRGDLGYRRQHAEGVGGEEDHFAGVAGLGDRLYDVVDVVDRVGHPGVLGAGGVVEVDLAIGVDGDILQQGIAADGVVDIRLVFLAEVDGLGVAAALEVENAVVIPAVLVVTDQLALGVGGEGGLAGAGEAEEDRHLTVLADVGGAVHGGVAFEGQLVVPHREYALFHLAAVPGAADQLHPLGHVEGHEVLGVKALFLPVGIG